MKKKLFRIGAGVLVAAIGAGALFAFAGCTSNHPEIRITYEFAGETYDVDYTLSRVDAPQTVQHFIELADAGFYDGLAIHDYQENTAMFSGGYRFDENGVLEEVDYLTSVQALEEKLGMKFTQSVWEDAAREKPLYTVKGEFKRNGVEPKSRENRHTKGALVMYYTKKGDRTPMVTVERYNRQYETKQYTYNSATSLFYTWLSSSSSKTNETTKEEYNVDNYCVFGMAKDYEGQLRDGLLKAIQDYIEERDEDYEFTKKMESVPLNQYDYFPALRARDVTADFNTPTVEPIIVKTVKVTKY